MNAFQDDAEHNEPFTSTKRAQDEGAVVVSCVAGQVIAVTPPPSDRRAECCSDLRRQLEVALVQGCQTHFHRGPLQHHGRPQRVITKTYKHINT